MTWYVALVRGVAPSTPPRTNADIVPVLAGLGFADVAAVQSSGNYVFTADAPDTATLEARIEDAFAARLGVRLLTIVRSQDQLRRLVEANPLAGMPHGPGSYQLVTFFKRPCDLGVPLPHRPDGLAVQFVSCVDGTLFSVIDNTTQPTVTTMTWLERRCTADLTSRTPLTLARILTKMGAGGAG